MESMFQLLTKRCLSLLYGRPFPMIMYTTILLPGIFFHALSWITGTVILYATLLHQVQDGVRQLTRTVRLLLVPMYSVSSR